MEFKMIRVNGDDTITTDLSPEEEVEFLLNTLFYGYCHNFAPDFKQMVEESFEKMATLHEREDFELDPYDVELPDDARNLELADLWTISIGNFVAFEEELKMFDAKEIEDFSDPLIKKLIEATDKIEKASQESADKAIELTMKMVAHTPILDSCTPMADIVPGHKPLPKVGKYTTKKYGPKK